MKFHFYSISFQNGIEVTELLGKQLSDCRPRVSEAPAGCIAIHTPDPQGGVPMVPPTAKAVGHSSRSRSRMLNIHQRICLHRKYIPASFQHSLAAFFGINDGGIWGKYYLLLTIQGRKVKKRSGCKLLKWLWNMPSLSLHSCELLLILPLPLSLLFKTIQAKLMSSSLTFQGRRWGIVRLVFEKQSALIRINYCFSSEVSFWWLLRASCYFSRVYSAIQTWDMMHVSSSQRSPCTHPRVSWVQPLSQPTGSHIITFLTLPIPPGEKEQEAAWCWAAA